MVNELNRREFLDGIDLEPYTRFIRRVKYSPQDKKWYMRCKHSRFEFLGLKPTIQVSPSAFDIEEVHPNIEDFRSTLVFHEGFHASRLDEEGFVRPDFFDAEGNSFFDALGELRAYENVIRHLTPQNSDLYKRHIEERRTTYLGFVRQLDGFEDAHYWLDYVGIK